MTTETQQEAMRSGVAANTDRELWRTTEGDYYSKHKIYISENSNALTICEGGYCITRPVEMWFTLSDKQISLPPHEVLVERMATDMRKKLYEVFPDNGTTDAFKARVLNSIVSAWMHVAANAALDVVLAAMEGK